MLSGGITKAGSPEYRIRRGFWIHYSRDLQYFSLNLGLLGIWKIWMMLGWGWRWEGLTKKPR